MPSVWIVEEGEYSDYRVVAIFSTQEQADTFSVHLPDSSVREWELDTWAEERAEFSFTFDLSGNITEIEEKAYTDPTKEDPPSGCRYEPDHIRVRVKRGPRERAIKIASEYYTRIRAHLDEATERVERLLPKENPHLRTIESLMVAEVLAGIKQLPNPPRCGYDEMVLTALGVKW